MKNDQNAIHADKLFFFVQLGPGNLSRRVVLLCDFLRTELKSYREEEALQNSIKMTHVKLLS